MFTRTLRNSLKREEGQALVLACLMVLILSIAVITTVNLGHNVVERVRLQNTADATAYSLAAQEARAFNFYAFANRTQVSHYVTAMMLQSLLSFIFWFEAWIVDLYGFIRSSLGVCSPPPFNPLSFEFILCAAAGILFPPLLSLFTQIASMMNNVRNLIQNTILKFINQTKVDRILGKIVIPLYRWIQGLFGATSQAMFMATGATMLLGSKAIMEENDPNTKYGFSDGLAGAINACLFERAHMPESGVGARALIQDLNPLKFFDGLKHTEVAMDSKTARAKSSMAQIANATRYSADRMMGSADQAGSDKAYYITNRNLKNALPIPSFLSFLGFLLDYLLPKKGQTRMLSHNQGKPSDMANWDKSNLTKKIDDTNAKRKNKIRDFKNTPSARIGDIATGDMLGADDLYRIGLPNLPFDIPGINNPFDWCNENDPPEACWGDPAFAYKASGSSLTSAFKTSVWATNKDQGTPNGRGLHFRLVTTPYTNQGGSPVYFRPPPNADLYTERFIGLNSKKVKVVGVKVAGVCQFPICIEWTVYTANVRPVYDGNHPWHGVMPFPHFEPGQYASDCSQPQLNGSKDAKQIAGRANGSPNASREFNQPSAWVFANKGAADLKNPIADPTATRNDPALLNGQGGFSMTFGSGGGTQLNMDNKNGFAGIPGAGMITSSRAQTYYHRPGNWAEQPNFFNPYWRPRLAPVWQGAYTLPLINQIKNALPTSPSFNGINPRNSVQKIMVH